MEFCELSDDKLGVIESLLPPLGLMIGV